MEDGASRQEVRAVKETLISELDLMARLVTDLTTRARLGESVIETVHGAGYRLLAS